MKEIIASREEMELFARRIIGGLVPSGKATIIGLEGDLGAGKTTFVQGAAKALGLTEIVQSPTFVIMKKYELHFGPWKQMIHIDCYRLDQPEDILALGWELWAAHPQTLIFVEWPERVRPLLEGYPRIFFRSTDEHTRQAEFEKGEILFKN